MITNPTFISKAMLGVLKNLWEAGEIEPDFNGDLFSDLFFPFTESEILGVHFHYSKGGDGVYFRLVDGRVFNSYGDECEGNPELYDTVAN